MSIRNFIKIDVHLFHNNKLKLIKSIEKRNWVTLFWIRLLTEAGMVNDMGLIYLSKNKPYSIEMLSDLFESPIEDIQYALDTLVKLDMIKIHEDNIIEITNWCKYQESKRKAKKPDKPKTIEEGITETIENQVTDVISSTTQSNTTEIENNTGTDNTLSTEIQRETVNKEAIAEAAVTTEEIDNSPKNMTFNFYDDNKPRPKKKKNKNSVKSCKNNPPIENIGTTEIIEGDGNNNPDDCFHDGEYRPEGELLWEVKFDEDDNAETKPSN